MITGVIQLLLSVLISAALAVTAPSLGHVTVQAIQNGVALSDKTADGQTIINQVQYTGLESLSQSTTTDLRFQGDSLPADTTVTIAIPESSLAKTVVTAADGTWEVELPATELPAGEHTAYMTTNDSTSMSDSVAVAEFTVHKTEALTQSTWVFLLSTFIAIVSLLLAITIQLRYNSTHYSVV